MPRPVASKPGHWSVSQVARMIGVSRSRVIQLDDVLAPIIEQNGAYKARWYSPEVVRAYANSRRTSTPIDERVNYSALQSLRALVVDNRPVQRPVRERRMQQASERAIQDFLRCVDLGIRQSDEAVGRPVGRAQSDDVPSKPSERTEPSKPKRNMPTASRWKPGTSGNPKGRPRGS